MKRLHTYSQNFLKSPRLALELVGHTNIKKKDLVIDIGAGSGVFTFALAKRAKEVIAIEPEPQTAAKLRQNMQNFNNVKIVQQPFEDFILPKTPYKICANIPFHLSAQILRKLVLANNPPSSIYLIVQKQFASRILNTPKNPASVLSVISGILYTARIRRPLRKDDFHPRPAVDTVFLELKLRETPLISPDQIKNFAELVEVCFHDPKTFQNLLAKTDLKSAKPSEFSAEDWAKIYRNITI
jgi:23S rRNA (adenine-N6)-dimethyltransferase